MTDVVTQQADVLSSLTFAPEGRKTEADLALRSTDVGRMSQDQFEAQFETSGERDSISIDGNRLSATATFTEADLDVDFVEPTTRSSFRTRKTRASSASTSSRKWMRTK